MTLTDLRYLVALSRERHFGRAAESCFVSQPTLSVAIRKLEEDLGVTLFERNKHDITLTPTGNEIVAQAKRVLDAAQILRDMARLSHDPLSAPLRLGAIFTVAPYVLPALIPVLHTFAPHMPLLLEENFTHKLTERLRQGELDAMLIALPLTEPGMAVQALYHEDFRVVIRRDHPWADRKTIHASELANEPLLLLGTGHCFRDQVLASCPALQHPAHPSSMQRTLESGSLETIRHMVASGTGITVMPCTATLHLPADQLLARPFQQPAPSRTVALVWRNSFPRPQAIAALIQAIRQTALPCVNWMTDS